MKKIKTILIILLFPFAVYGVLFLFNKNSLANTVEAVGNLTITYLGVPLGAPIFNITNMLPGGPPQTRTIKIKNDSKNTSQIYVKAIRRGPNGQKDPKLETALILDIYEGNDHFFSSNLSKFFSDTNNNKGLRLEDLKKGSTENYNFRVNFPSSAGNEYQNKSVTFDLAFSDNSPEVKGAHDEKGDGDKDHDDPKKDIKKKISDDLKNFGDKCKSAFNKIFKHH